jgi:serine/threonine protein kinase
MAVLERGGRPDAEGLLARYPDLAEVLGDYLRDLDQLHAAAVNLRDSLPSRTGRPEAEPIPESECLGDFRIIREIGRGGMGVVYEAEQMSLGRRVALKVLPLAAALDARQLQRFQVEAHAAACLHHTNIVPIHAVGCERGVPYYAMQLIEGRSLAELIQETRRLDGLAPADASRPEDSRVRSLVEEVRSGRTAADKGQTSETKEIPDPRPSSRTPRPSSGTRHYIQMVARLGIQAAEALEHAHQRGVLHRDIKPANLLLDSQGTLWVTDFGLARLPGEVNLTATGDLLGTLRYMSPEQALGKRVLIDGRTDIYSLGVTLYELLTLQSAFDGKDRQEILRQIAEKEPRSLRRLNPSVPSDLETIVHKAIAKEPASRYATAQELADDLRRFLEQKPIRARRPTIREQVLKWGRRHPSAVVSTLVVFVLATLGLSFGIVRVDWERNKAMAQQRRAETYLGQAREAVDQMLTEVGQETLSNVPHLEPVRRALLEKALGFYEKLLTREGDDLAIRLETGRAYRRVGDIQHLLGQNDRASEAYHNSIEILRKLVTSDPANLDSLRDLAESHRKYGEPLDRIGRTEEAEREVREAIELRKAVLERSSGNPDDRLAWAVEQGVLGVFLFYRGRLGEAREIQRTARDVLARLVADFPDEPRYQSCLGALLNDLASTARRQEDLTDARTLLVEAVSHQQAALRIDPQNLRYRIFSRNHQENLAEILSSLGQRSEAVKILRQCVSVGEAIASDFPSVPSYREDLAGTYGNLALLLSGMGADRREEAAHLFDKTIQLFQSLATEYPGVSVYRRQLATVRMNLGFLYRVSHRWKDEEQSLRAAIELREALVAAEPANAALKRDLADGKYFLAQLLVSHRDSPVYDPAQAARLAREATKLVPEEVQYWKGLGRVHYLTGNWRAFVDAMEAAMQCRDGGKLNPPERFCMAMARWRLGEKDAARTLFNEAAAEMDKSKSRDETSLILRADAAALLGRTDATAPEKKETNHSN